MGDKIKHDIEGPKNLFTQIGNSLSRLKKTCLVAVLLAIAAAIISTANFTDAIQKLANLAKITFYNNLQINIRTVNTLEDVDDFVSTLKKEDVNNWMEAWQAREFPLPALIPQLALLDITFINVGTDPVFINSVELRLEQRSYEDKRERDVGTLCIASPSGYYNMLINPLAKQQKVTIALAEAVMPKSLDRFIISFGSTIDNNRINIENRIAQLRDLLLGQSELIKKYIEAYYEHGLLDHVEYYAEFDAILKFAINNGGSIYSTSVEIQFKNDDCLTTMSEKPLVYFHNDSFKLVEPDQ